MVYDKSACRLESVSISEVIFFSSFTIHEDEMQIKKKKKLSTMLSHPWAFVPFTDALLDFAAKNDLALISKNMASFCGYYGAKKCLEGWSDRIQVPSPCPWRVKYGDWDE